MKNEEYLTVKDFASTVGVSHQYIYKASKTKLKPYVKRIKGKVMIHSSAIDLFTSSSDGCATNSTSSLQLEKHDNRATSDPIQQENFATNSTEKLATNATSCKNTQKDNVTKNETDLEIKILRELIEELRKSNEELKKDKETLIKDKETLLTESFKWQQLFLEERNKNKMLEARKESDEEIIETIEEIVKDENTDENTIEEKPKKKWFEFWK